MAETRAKAERAFDDWTERYDDKYSKATACLERDRDELLTFYAFPAAHWTHLRTTNVIESAFATIRHRSSRAKGCVTRQTMLSMIGTALVPLHTGLDRLVRRRRDQSGSCMLDFQSVKVTVQRY